MPSTLVEEKATAKRTIECSQCAKTAQVNKRLPTGWKHPVPETYYCGDCWRGKYILRAITLQIAEPQGLSWDDLRTALKVMWRETTRASNWMMRQLALADVEREPGVTKMPPMPRSYLYPVARQQFPVLPSQTVAALEQAVTAKYKAKRYEIVWTCAAALPTFRYPQPFPVHNQSWTVAMENDSPVVSVRMGEHRIQVRLKSGNRYRRQLAGIRSIADGSAVPGECAIYEQGTAIMVKMVAWLPRRAAANQMTGILRVRSSAESLIVAVNEKDETLWSYHADQIPRWAAEHRRQLQRWADDSKFEQRPVPLFATRRTEASLRYHRRVNSAADQAAAYLVNYARRRKFAEILWDDTERAFCPDFVWFRLESRIKTLADEYGIVFTHANGPVMPKSQPPLAST